MQQLIISFLSVDRPGLVDQLSQVIQRYQGNWQVSSMHHLSGHFAGVIEVAVDMAQLGPLQQALTELAGFDFQFAVAEQVVNEPRAKLVLEIMANDRAGIVQDITSVIHKQGGNLAKLVSNQDIAAHTGQVIFKAKATVLVEPSTQALLIDALETLADDLMVDIVKS